MFHRLMVLSVQGPEGNFFEIVDMGSYYEFLYNCGPTKGAVMNFLENPKREALEGILRAQIRRLKKVPMRTLELNQMHSN